MRTTTPVNHRTEARSEELRVELAYGYAAFVEEQLNHPDIRNILASVTLPGCTTTVLVITGLDKAEFSRKQDGGFRMFQAATRRLNRILQNLLFGLEETSNLREMYFAIKNRHYKKFKIGITLVVGPG